MTDLKTNNLSDIASYSVPLQLYDNAPGDPIPVYCTPVFQEKLNRQNADHLHLLQRIMQVKIRPHKDNPQTLLVYPDIKGKRPSPVFDTQANQCSLILKEIIAQWQQGKETGQADVVNTTLRVINQAPNEGQIRKRMESEHLIASNVATPAPIERVKKERPKKIKEKTRGSKPGAEEIMARRLEKLNRDTLFPHTPKEEIKKIDGIVFGTNLSRVIQMDTCHATGKDRLSYVFIAPEIADPRAFDKVFMDETKNVHKDPVNASDLYHEELKTFLSVEQLSQLHFSDSDYKMGIAVHFIDGQQPEITPVKAKITSIIPHDMIDLRFNPDYDGAFQQVAGYNQVISMMRFIKNNLSEKAGVEDSKKQNSCKPAILAKSMANCVEIMAQRAIQSEILQKNIPAIHFAREYDRDDWEQHMLYHSTSSVRQKNITKDNSRVPMKTSEEAFLLNGTLLLHRLTTGTDLLDDKTVKHLATIHHYQVKKNFRLNKRILDPNPEAYVNDLEITKVYEQIRKNKEQQQGEPTP